MSNLLPLIGLATAGGVLSLAGALLMITFRSQLEKKIVYFSAFAAGVLIAVSTIDLLPHAYEHGDPGLWFLIGILLMYLLEQTNIWFHHHHAPHGVNPSLIGIWFGDTLHNLLDGVAIGVAFLIDPAMGVTTALAVAMHELPQEMADFMLYIKGGVSRWRTIAFNIVSSLFTVAGALAVYFMGEAIEVIEVPAIAFTAGMFLHIALSDLLPDLHHKKQKDLLIPFSIGIVISYLSISYFAGMIHV